MRSIASRLRVRCVVPNCPASAAVLGSRRIAKYRGDLEVYAQEAARFATVTSDQNISRLCHLLRHVSGRNNVASVLFYEKACKVIVQRINEASLHELATITNHLGSAVKDREYQDADTLTLAFDALSDAVMFYHAKRTIPFVDVASIVQGFAKARRTDAEIYHMAVEYALSGTAGTPFADQPRAPGWFIADLTMSFAWAGRVDKRLFNLVCDRVQQQLEGLRDLEARSAAPKKPAGEPAGVLADGFLDEEMVHRSVSGVSGNAAVQPTTEAKAKSKTAKRPRKGAAPAVGGTLSPSAVEALRAEIMSNGFSPGELIRIGTAFASLRHTDLSPLRLAARVALTQISYISHYELVNIVYACVVSGVNAPMLLIAAARRLVSQLDLLTPHMVVRMAWSYASAGVGCDVLFPALVPYTAQLAVTLGSDDLAKYVWAFARAGHKDSVVYDRLRPAIVRNVDRFSTEQVSDVLYAYAAAGRSDRELIFFGNSVVNKRTERELSTSSLGVMLWAGATMATPGDVAAVEALRSFARLYGPRAHLHFEMAELVSRAEDVYTRLVKHRHDKGESALSSLNELCKVLWAVVHTSDLASGRALAARNATLPSEQHSVVRAKQLVGGSIVNDGEPVDAYCFDVLTAIAAKRIGTLPVDDVACLVWACKSARHEYISKEGWERFDSACTVVADGAQSLGVVAALLVLDATARRHSSLEVPARTVAAAFRAAVSQIRLGCAPPRTLVEAIRLAAVLEQCPAEYFAAIEYTVSRNGPDINASVLAAAQVVWTRLNRPLHLLNQLIGDDSSSSGVGAQRGVSSTSHSPDQLPLSAGLSRSSAAPVDTDDQDWSSDGWDVDAGLLGETVAPSQQEQNKTTSTAGRYTDSFEGFGDEEHLGDDVGVKVEAAGGGGDGVGGGGGARVANSSTSDDPFADSFDEGFDVDEFVSSVQTKGR